MKNDQIEVGHDYYGYDCADNGVFRLLRYNITSKETWACSGTRYAVDELGSGLIGFWRGYPDNLHKTKEEAIAALKAHVKALEEKHFPTKLEPKVHIVNAVTVEACCDTCTELKDDCCMVYHVRISNPSNNICKEGGYNCDPEAINNKVIEVQK